VVLVVTLLAHGCPVQAGSVERGAPRVDALRHARRFAGAQQRGNYGSPWYFALSSQTFRVPGFTGTGCPARLVAR
jgi:hypothetical protein